jgi:hypothetical protein
MPHDQGGVKLKLLKQANEYRGAVQVLLRNGLILNEFPEGD